MAMAAAARGPKEFTFAWEGRVEEVSETLRRHPVNVEFWQVLGDSYMRIDDLQQALDAYTKAEELLR